MDQNLIDAPLLRLWLELPYLARDIFEGFEQQVKPLAIEFNLFVAFCLIHHASLFWRFPQFDFIAIRIYKPAKRTIFELFDFSNDWRSAFLYLPESFLQIVNHQIEHEFLLRRCEVI